MRFHRSAGSFALLSSLVALAVVACAEGSDADPEGAGTGDTDAGAVEASAIPPREDADVEPEDEDDAGDTDSGAPPSACAKAIAAVSFDFEGSDQGWVHAVSDGAANAASWPFDPWTRGTSATIPCPDGQCFGAERSQNYAQCHRGELISPRIDLAACVDEKVSLVFSHAYAFWSGSFNGQTWFDGGVVMISKDDGATWQVPSGTYPGTVKILGTRGSYNCVLPNGFHVDGKSGFTGTQQTASTIEIAMPAGSLTANVRVRFSQAAGVSTAANEHARAGTAAGWRVDDVHFALK
ncbi:MAG: hypothetical protein KF795_28435 [Labilithrix sp.]|nr:hypothetical protein [Labilithrix sp.]